MPRYDTIIFPPASCLFFHLHSIKITSKLFLLTVTFFKSPNRFTMYCALLPVVEYGNLHFHTIEYSIGYEMYRVRLLFGEMRNEVIMSSRRKAMNSIRFLYKFTTVRFDATELSYTKDRRNTQQMARIKQFQFRTDHKGILMALQSSKFPFSEHSK